MPHSPPAPHFLDKVRRDEPAAATRPLSGRVALVTGSGRGVGRTIARFLAHRGATVIVNSFHSREQGEQTAAEINAGGGRAVHIWGSVANPEHVGEMFRQIENQLGLALLVATRRMVAWAWTRPRKIGIARFGQASRGITNARSDGRVMRPRGGGSIVTMSAVSAPGDSLTASGSQGVVKAAVESLTRYLACSLGPQRHPRRLCHGRPHATASCWGSFPRREPLRAAGNRWRQTGNCVLPWIWPRRLHSSSATRHAEIMAAVWGCGPRILSNGRRATVQHRVSRIQPSEVARVAN